MSPTKIKREAYKQEFFVDDLKNIRLSKPAKPFQSYNGFVKKLDQYELFYKSRSNKIKSLTKNNLKQKIHLSCNPLLNKSKNKIYFNNEFKKLTYDNLKNFIALNPNKISNKSTQVYETKFNEKFENLNEKHVICLKDNWVSLFSNAGVEFYLNLSNGTTTYDINKVKKTPIFISNKPENEKNLQNFPKDLSLKLIFDQDQNDLSLKNVIQSLKNEKFKKWESPLNDMNYEMTNFDSSDCKILSEKFKYDITVFDQLKIIGQFDLKFIVASYELTQKNGYSLFLFDQHACHERIRLEYIIQENIDDDLNLISAESFNETIKLCLNQFKDKKPLETLKKKMKPYGFRLELNEQYLVINRIPKILFNKYLREKKEAIRIIVELINKILELDNPNIDDNSDKKFFFSHIPKQLLDLFNMEACRSAIKFGDKLSIHECNILIQDLKKCKLPFQCAHGRPTLLPVINLIKRKETKPKLNFKKLIES